MSYTLYSGATIEAAGPMLLDILAIQYLYGANMTTRAGDTSYVFRSSTEELKCIWDAGGVDMFDVSNQSVAATIDLRAGSFSSIGRKNNGAVAVGNIGIAYNVVIEDAFGTSFNDKITGNDANNRLRGWIGNDTIDGGPGKDLLDGGAGADSMIGGLGDDYYLVDNASDKLSETASNGAGGGIDYVESTVSFSLAVFANVDNLQLVGAGASNGTGNAQANTILGNGFGNILDGGGGVDILRGGVGTDTYIIDNLADVIDEQGAADSGDTVQTSAAIANGIAGIENYVFTGVRPWIFAANDLDNSVTGGAGNDGLDGGLGHDTLLGGDGQDTLIGRQGGDILEGGTGVDTLKGGAGDDTYVVDNAGDVIDEEGNTDAWDVVLASVSVNLSTLGAGLVEHAYLLGSAALSATGNGLGNQLVGNSGANTLDGGGGTDNLIGGGGNDTYIVDNALDSVVETIAGAAGGTDLVQSSVIYSLASRANVENLTLTGGLAIDATGNMLNNVLTGNGAANRLDGGTGSDTLVGGGGDDTYVVDSAGDVVNETIGAGGGFDTVESSVSFSLASRVNIENLTLGGVAGIEGIGNALANTILGNSAGNVLDGSAGADTLKGGAGNDTYVIDNAGDVIDEEGNADAWDVVLTSVSVNLSTLGAGLEHAYLLGTAALTATGNGLGNQLVGNSGANTLGGGGGADNLIGGGGRDTFDYNHLSDAGDTITDFVLGVAGDILNLADLLDDIGYGGANPFADAVLAFTASGANTLVRVDADGGGAAITLATLTNVTLSQANTDNYVV